MRVTCSCDLIPRVAWRPQAIAGSVTQDKWFELGAAGLGNLSGREQGRSQGLWIPPIPDVCVHCYTFDQQVQDVRLICV